MEVNWEEFVKLMKDESRPSEELYKKMVDELKKSRILSDDPEGNYYIVHDCVLINPQNLPYRPSGILFFTRKNDAEGYAKAMYPNADHKPEVFKYKCVLPA